jgi:hypothetical protein
MRTRKIRRTRGREEGEGEERVYNNFSNFHRPIFSIYLFTGKCYFILGMK